MTEESYTPISPRTRGSALGARMSGTWERFLTAGDHLLTAIIDRLHTMIREKDLFLGLILLTIGLVSFESGRYCDGNTAEYLSCTRPATYYYFDWLDVICIILGVVFIALWRVIPKLRKR